MFVLSIGAEGRLVNAYVDCMCRSVRINLSSRIYFVFCSKGNKDSDTWNGRNRSTGIEHNNLLIPIVPFLICRGTHIYAYDTCGRRNNSIMNGSQMLTNKLQTGVNTRIYMRNEQYSPMNALRMMKHQIEPFQLKWVGPANLLFI